MVKTHYLRRLWSHLTSIRYKVFSFCPMLILLHKMEKSPWHRPPISRFKLDQHYYMQCKQLIPPQDVLDTCHAWLSPSLTFFTNGSRRWTKLAWSIIPSLLWSLSTYDSIPVWAPNTSHVTTVCTNFRFSSSSSIQNPQLSQFVKILQKARVITLLAR